MKEFAHIFNRKSTNRKVRSNVECPRNKQKNFGSNRNKQNKIGFSCVSVCFEPISKQPKQIELFRNEPKQTETTQNLLKNTKILSLSNCFGWSSVCFGSNRNIETLCFGIEAKQTVLKQTKTNRNKPEKT
jgi:hypothetical protein